MPVIMMGKDFWSGLVDWISERLLADKLISPEDMDLFHLVDEPEEALSIVQNFYPG